MPQPRLAPNRLVHCARDEAHVAKLDLAHCQLLPAPHYQLVGRSVDLDHVPRPRLRQIAEAAALSDRVKGRAPIAAQLASPRVDPRTHPDRQPPRQVPPAFAPRHDATLPDLRLARDL